MKRSGTKVDSTALLACPFCGASARLVGRARSASVYCTGCSARMKVNVVDIVIREPATAVVSAWWNRRHANTSREAR